MKYVVKDINLEDGLIRRKKIPVLILNKEWKILFEEYMTKDMLKSAKELREMLSEEKQSELQLRIIRKQKKQLMEKILLLSEEINNSEKKESINKMEETKEQILEINKKIDELEYNLEILPKKIENLNLTLLKDTINIAYGDIKEGGSKIKTLTEEITKLRETLRLKWEDKLYWEKRTQQLYSYLHDNLGHEETNKLDRHFL